MLRMAYGIACVLEHANMYTYYLVGESISTFNTAVGTPVELLGLGCTGSPGIIRSTYGVFVCVTHFKIVLSDV